MCLYITIIIFERKLNFAANSTIYDKFVIEFKYKYGKSNTTYVNKLYKFKLRWLYLIEYL